MDYYRSHRNSISGFYNTVTKNCHVHRPIFELSQMNTKILDYLISIPNLFEKLGLLNLLASYENFNSGNLSVEKFQVVWQFASVSTILKGIIYGIDYKSDSSQEFYDNCKPIRFLVGRRNPTVENIWAKMNFDADIQAVLTIITPFVGECKCNRSCDNYDFAVFHYKLPVDRIDLIEKIIWGTKLNDFFYFINVRNKLIDCKKQINTINILPDVVKIDTFDEKQKARILDSFQQNPHRKFLFVNSSTCISTTKLSYGLSNETYHIGIIHKPDTCFVCDKYDIKTTVNLTSNELTITKIEEKVDNFACKKCKKKIAKALNLNHVTKTEFRKKEYSDYMYRGQMITNINHLTNLQFKEPYNLYMNKSNIFEKYSSYESHNVTKDLCKYRWSIPILLISSNMYDHASVFNLLPIEIIHAIILSTYWDISNTLVDISNEPIDNTILFYSKFRVGFSF